MTKLCTVRRAATPPSFKPNRPWEGSFDFIINHRPPGAWWTIATGHYEMLGEWPSITGNVITLSCEPERLQFITEQFIKWLAVVDQAYEDFCAHPEKRDAFERELDKAVNNLVIPNIN
jgi:hypothetical protein